MSKIKHTTSFRIDQPADILFPLFSAEGEKHWVPGWDYENVMGSTEMHEDYVFLTANHHKPQHDQHKHVLQHHQPKHHEESKMIWLVKKHDPSNYFVQFYRVEPNEKVGIVTVHCTSITENSTDVEVSYEYIAINKKGEHFIKHHTVEVYEESISHWPILLNKYFEAHS